MYFFFGNKLLAQKLVKAIGDYLSLQTIINTIQKTLERESTLGKNNSNQLLFSL